MTGIIVKIIVFGLIFWFVASGVRRLIRDFTTPFRNMAGPGARPTGFGSTPPRPDMPPQTGTTVIDLKRGDDGVYRPPGEGK